MAGHFRQLYHVNFAAYRPLFSALLFLGGAVVAVFVTGRLEVVALAAVALGAGFGLLLGQPSVRPGWLPVALGLLLAVAAGSSFLPAGAGLPAWRLSAPDQVALAASFAAMPAHLIFWWVALFGTIATALFVVASPLDLPSLRVFLHAVSATIGVYALVSIAQAHTGWSYPLSGGANFGLLPNRNHTATLLVVGSVVSFGVMQWEVSNGHRIAAVVSALWGAPALAALLFFSTSRAGVLFLAAGFMLWGLGAMGSAVSRRTSLITAALLALFLTALFVFGGSTVRDRLGALWQDVMATESGAGEGRQVDFRQPVFRDTASMIADAPLTGQGMGHFEFVFPHYREASLRAVGVLHPESDWLMVAAESGIPAVVALLGLVAWYFGRCWRARGKIGGSLRWTAASAIGAALLHGLIDVPWHRPALGWFLLVVALFALPSSAGSLGWPRLWRALQAALGLCIVTAGVSLARDAVAGRSPVPYRWAAYVKELGALSAERKHQDGELLAGKAIGDFPLHYQAYYWRAGFLRTFEGTDPEIQNDIAAGQFAEPVLPVVAAEQAQIWEDIDPEQEVAARVEAIRRAGLIDRRLGTTGASFAELEKGMRAAQERPIVQRALRERLGGDSLLEAQWACLAKEQLADEFLASLTAGGTSWLDSLPQDLRSKVLARWITLPSAAVAVAYMEARNAPAPGAYWRQLAVYHAKVGDKPRAVGMVAEAEGVSLEAGASVGGEFGTQLDQLRLQGNEVAVRRLLREAADGQGDDTDKAAVAMVYYAQAGDWEMAWKAASRLVTASKNRH